MFSGLDTKLTNQLLKPFNDVLPEPYSVQRLQSFTESKGQKNWSPNWSSMFGIVPSFKSLGEADSVSGIMSGLLGAVASIVGAFI